MAAKVYSSSDIRNIALVGHGGSGKTSIAEAMLYLTGANNRLGSVDNATSVLDFEPEEQKRVGSIATSLAWVEYEGVKVNILDTPGDQNFIFDSLNALRGADAAVVVVSAPDGIEVGTQRVFHEAANLGLPRIVVINKMDRERADPEGCLTDFEETFGMKALPLQVPMGKEHAFKGVIDLLSMKAYTYGEDGQITEGDIPAEYNDAVEAAHEFMVEEVASTDEELLEKYLETMELSRDEVVRALTAGLASGSIVPLLYGAGRQCVGVNRLLHLVRHAVPAPLARGSIETEGGSIQLSESGPFVAQVIHTTIDEFSGKVSIFRIFSGNVPEDNQVVNTTKEKHERLGALFTLRGKERETTESVAGDIVAVAKLKDTRTGDTLVEPKDETKLPTVQYPPPMMSYVIHPAGKGAEDKLKTALERLMEEDPTLTVSFEDLTNQMVLNGMGQAHLDMAVDRMDRKFKVSVTTDLPPVPYRETLQKPVKNIEGKHKKQTGGAGQFGVCYINVEPLDRNGGFEFVDMVKGGSIPRQFIPSVEKGILSKMKSGFLAGYPIIDVRVELIDGKYHPVDSKDVAFQLAGSKGLKAAFEKGGTKLLEPMYEMEVVAPGDNVGDIMGDITGRRGRVLGMEPRGKNTVINAICPLAEIQRYAPDLRGMTGGKGSFTMSFYGYEEVQPNMVAKIVAASPFTRDEEED